MAQYTIPEYTVEFTTPSVTIIAEPIRGIALELMVNVAPMMDSGAGLAAAVLHELPFGEGVVHLLGQIKDIMDVSARPRWHAAQCLYPYLRPNAQAARRSTSSPAAGVLSADVTTSNGTVTTPPTTLTTACQAKGYNDGMVKNGLKRLDRIWATAELIAKRKLNEVQRDPTRRHYHHPLAPRSLTHPAPIPQPTNPAAPRPTDPSHPTHPHPYPVLQERGEARGLPRIHRRPPSACVQDEQVSPHQGAARALRSLEPCGCVLRNTAGANAACPRPLPRTPPRPNPLSSLRWVSKTQLWKRIWGARKYREIFQDVFRQLDDCTEDLTLTVAVDNQGSLDDIRAQLSSEFQAGDALMHELEQKLDAFADRFDDWAGSQDEMIEQANALIEEAMSGLEDKQAEFESAWQQRHDQLQSALDAQTVLMQQEFDSLHEKGNLRASQAAEHLEAVAADMAQEFGAVHAKLDGMRLSGDGDFATAPVREWVKALELPPQHHTNVFNALVDKCGISSPRQFKNVKHADLERIQAQVPKPRRGSFMREWKKACGNAGADGGAAGGGSKAQKAADDLPPIVKQKLEDPEMELSPEQEIEYLKACIELGRRKAEAVTAGCENLLVFIGNSGSGKSTLVSSTFFGVPSTPVPFLKRPQDIDTGARIAPPRPPSLPPAPARD